MRSWAPATKPEAFTDSVTLNREAQNVRLDHHLTPDDAVEIVARCLWRHVNHRQLDVALSKLPVPVRVFWSVSVNDPAEITQRMY